MSPAVSSGPLTVLFLMRHAVYVRMWETVLAELAERGHRIHLGFERRRPEAEIADRLARTYPGITYGYVPHREDRWKALAYGLRQSADYLRYLRPEYEHAWKLRARATRGPFRVVLRLTRLQPFRSRPGLAVLAAGLRFLERRIPRSPAIDRYLLDSGADVVMATPLVNDPAQRDYMRSARALGKVCALPVNSWDNLTNKGVVQESLDRVYVWNDIQRREAVELHGVPPAAVAVVGAHSFDHWFRWRPSTTRAEFCERIGLDPEEPYALYVCSSKFISADERPVVRRWLEAVRGAGDARLDAMGVLVRPHPAQPRLWLENPLAGMPQVAVWPLEVTDPRNDEARSHYYDSLYHSALVVGLNTSALIEAAIVGRRSYTFTLPELSGGQEGTLHFHYLVAENGGPLTVGHSLDEHVSDLAAALVAPPDEGWSRGFVQSFVRPNGLDRAAAPLLADDLEQVVVGFEPRRVRTYRASALLRPLAWLADTKGRRGERWKARRRRRKKAARRVVRLARTLLRPGRLLLRRAP